MKLKIEKINMKMKILP